MRSLLFLLIAMFVSVSSVAGEIAPAGWQSPTQEERMRIQESLVPSVDAAGEWIGPFFLPNSDPMTLYLYGDIEEGAALDFRRALARRPKTDLVYLVSAGGRVGEALVIAREIAAANITTAVPTGHRCYSACAFMFFAGSMRTAFGIVGVHQISGRDVDASTIQVALSVVLDALSAFEVPQRVISAMLRTPPNGMHILGPDELATIDAYPGSHLDEFAGIVGARTSN